MRTRAAVALEAGKPLEIMEVDLDGPRAGEVLVEIKATGICHTDEFTLSGADPEGIFPAILGHEGAGVVVDVGPGVTSLKAIDRDGLYEGLLSLCGPGARSEISRLTPSHYEAPTGSRVPIRYDEGSPVVAIRVQELFGETRHPAIAGGRLPLTLELLSPAQRPIQTTRDLPGFWAGSWADVRAEMRGRYPRHPWPENPAEAAPTHRAKPRGT